MKKISNIQITERTCSKCSEKFNTYLNSNSYLTICPKCGLKYNSYNGFLEKTNTLIKVHDLQVDIPIGTTGTINNIKYLVIAYAYQNETGTNYYWHEYTLFNPVYGTAYLSQYNGHWTYLTELNDYPVISARIATYQGTEYDLFAKYKAKVNKAFGEFIYNFSADDLTSVEEYVISGYMISRETTADNITWFLGEYIEPNVIKDSFKLAKIPIKKGVGMIEPFHAKFQSESFKSILKVLVIIWGIMQFYFLIQSKNETVFSQSFHITDTLNKKEIYSKPFELKYGTTNAEVRINTNVDNNWMYTGVTFVNEKTGDLYDVDLEAEYYHGYEGGENWSEGSNWTSKVISQVPEGTYYLIIYPDKPSAMSDAFVDISVKRDVFVLSNGIFILILLGLYPAFYFNRVQNFEKERWYNSNYSTYED